MIAACVAYKSTIDVFSSVQNRCYVGMPTKMYCKLLPVLRLSICLPTTLARTYVSHFATVGAVQHQRSRDILAGNNAQSEIARTPTHSTPTISFGFSKNFTCISNDHNHHASRKCQGVSFPDRKLETKRKKSFGVW